MTAKNIIMTCSKEKYSGLKMPSLAISIIPAEVNAPIKIPPVATHIMVRKDATFDPMAEFRKFTASFPTPTIKSPRAKTAKMMTPINKNVSKILRF